jgi:hypothetical protein
VEAEGEEKKATAAYIKLRVQRLKDEMMLGKLMENERLGEIQAIREEEEEESFEKIIPTTNELSAPLKDECMRDGRPPAKIYWQVSKGDIIEEGEIIAELKIFDLKKQINLRDHKKTRDDRIMYPRKRYCVSTTTTFM